MIYRPEIDGLRAVAVLPVVFFHAGFNGFSGGFVGVDVFFVISGFLITSILLDELKDDRFSLLKFYERRARRILPALYLVVLICIPVAWFWMLPTQFAEFGRSISAVGLFISNFEFSNQVGYFAPTADEMPLLHTWSLAVEEQFYIVFPIMLFLLWRQKLWSRSIVVPVLLSFLVASFLVSDWAAWVMPTENFYLIPTRAWELLVGVLCAIALRSRGGVSFNTDTTFSYAGFVPRIGGALALLGIVMIVLAVFFYSKDTPFPSRYALLPVGGTALIILFASPRTFAARLLALPPLVAIGLISYSAYLWHQPLLAFYRIQRIDDQSALALAALIIAAFILAYLTWRFIENPFRHGKVQLFRTQRQVLTLSLATSLMLVVAGVIIDKNNGFENRYDRLNQHEYRWNNRKLQKETWSILRTIANDKRYRVARNEYDRQANFNPEDARENILIVGNSHSKDLFNTFYFSNSARAKYEFTRFGVQIRDLDGPHQFYESPLFKNTDRIIMASAYSELDLNALPAVVERIKMHGISVILTTRMPRFPGKKRWTFADEIILPLLQKQSGALPSGIAKQLAGMINREYWSRLQESDATYETNQLVAEIAQRTDSVLLDRSKTICEKQKQRCFAVSDKLGKYLYDNSHLTMLGAMEIARRIDDIGWLDPLN